MDGLILALDFGGTKLSAAVPKQSRSGWNALERRPSPAEPDAAYDLKTIVELGHKVLEGEIPQAIGVSFGGPVDAKRGVVKLSHHVSGWENIPLAAMLEDTFAAIAYVDNDANAGALGEYVYGAGKTHSSGGCNSLLYITVSTGVGGGWVLDSRIWHGANSMAGEIGHTVVDPQGPTCLCGKRGCVERLVSGPFMAQDAQAALTRSPEKGRILLNLASLESASGEAKITGEMISRAAALGDELAIEILKRGAWALGTGIGNAANLMNPELVILGGGVTKSGALFWDTVRLAARNTALPEVSLEILPARTGDDAPLWGAVALAEAFMDPAR